MDVKHAALCSSGSGKPNCDCGAEVRALREELAQCKRLLTHAGLVAAQEEHNALREDAEKWRAYEARKRAVIAAGMGKKVLRDTARKGRRGG